MDEKTRDERYHVAEEAILDAFFLVLKEKELDKITVSDIIKKAGIVRSTFYNHFEDIPNLINAIEDKTVNDIFSLMKTFHPENDWDMCKSFYLTICEYTMTNPFLASLLRDPQENTFFRKTVTMFHRYVQKVTQTTAAIEHSKEDLSYMIACSIGSTIGVLHKWAKDQFRDSPEYVANLLTRVFLSGMLPNIL